jgi:hypothetical protein
LCRFDVAELLWRQSDSRYRAFPDCRHRDDGMSNSRWSGYLIVDLHHDPAGLYDPQIQFSGTTGKVKAKGDLNLTTVWPDPEFDLAPKAFYYVRVIEIPTSR